MNDIQIDPRGPRFSAFFQLAFSVSALLVGANVGGVVIMAVLLALFIPGAIIGPQATVQGWIFRTAVRPRLAPPAETESFRPPRFAQQMGLTFSTLAVASGLLGWDPGFFLFTGFVTFASFLNSVFDLCLGCEIYLLFKRVTTRATV
ncbi:DUF4395 domain-containing protein [Demequina mangrovi]|uniref:DUF4395 domain-containing protein n=1 Tax=Demequina mangrovi TaxID=1043493 RepID=A0A1H6W731_9MICO|nr:DUF4395 domain-containing protein [Demequina mangrovi]SEJ09877.1 protein of unknown function [Demequina mangrovi]